MANVIKVKRSNVPGKIPSTADVSAGEMAVNTADNKFYFGTGTNVQQLLNANAEITGGTNTKITFDSNGLIVGGSDLIASDIPNLDWSKITTGTPTTLSGYGINDAQPLNANLTAITELIGTGLLKKDGINWSLDSSSYLTENQEITLLGDANGSGKTSLNVTLVDTGIPIGTYPKVTVDSKGRVTGGYVLSASDIPALDWSKIFSGKPTTLSGYGITDGVNTALLDAANGIPLLDANGLLQTKYLPALAISETFVVANQTEMLGLTAQKGDIAVRSDLGKSFILATNDPTQLANWTELLTTGAVSSVNGQTGTVNITTITGNAGTASALQTARNISIIGAGTGTTSFSGAADASITLTLVDSGVAAGTYSKVTVTNKGIVTGGAALLASDIPNLDWSKITSGLPTTLGGYGITNAVVANTAISGATHTKITYDSKGLVTGGTDLVAGDIPALDWTKITTGKPTTLSGYGITDAQALSTSLTNIAALAGTSGFLKKTGASTWTLDTSTYLTTNQTITFTGDATGSGTTSVALTLANSGVTASTYTKVTVNAKGLVTAGASLSATDIPVLDWSKITTGKPTTLAGYGITNGVVANTAITAGTGTKISYDAKGLVTGSDVLAESDIPNLNWSKITSGKPTTVDGYGITDAVKTSQINAANGVAGLDANGKVLTSVLPAVAINDTFVVTSQVDMLALTAQRGDTAVRTDLNKTFILSTDDPTQLANWTEMLSSGMVTSVNGSTGAVNVTDITGNAGTATKLQTSRNFIFSGGDVTGSGSFDGTANAVINLTIADNGVSLGTYPKVTVNSKGLVTAGSALSATDIPNLDWAKITTGKPTTLAGYGITNGVVANTAITAGTGTKITYDAKGLVTSATTLSATDIPSLDWSKITTGKPTSLLGYGITDAQGLNSNLTAISGLGTFGLVALTAAGAVAARTITGTTNTIAVTNGNGVSNNPVITIADNPVIPGTGSLTFPNGTSVQRPASPSNGMLRFNSDLGITEIYTNGVWEPVPRTATLSAIQCRRTTTYTLTTTATNLTLDTVDLATRSTVIARDATNTDRIYVYEDGTYQLSFTCTIIDTTNTNTDTIRFKLNNSTLINGGGRTISPRSTRMNVGITCIATLNAGDFVNLEALRTGSATGTLQADLVVNVIKLEGSKGDTGISGGLGTLQYSASNFDNPTNANWAINALAPVIADTANNALSVRAFDDTAEEGIGFTLYIPPATTNIQFNFNFRASTAPASTAAAILRMYTRTVNVNSAVSAWSSAYTLNTVSVPTNAYFQTFSQTVSLASLGISDATTVQFELTRYGASASDTLLGDLHLLSATISFT